MASRTLPIPMNLHFQFVNRSVINSIAFLPAIISLLFFLFLVLAVYLELSFPGKDTQLGENMQVLLVKDNEKNFPDRAVSDEAKLSCKRYPYLFDGGP
jgi:hypothetical protein